MYNLRRIWLIFFKCYFFTNTGVGLLAPVKVTLDLPDALWAVSINGSFTEIVICFVLFINLLTVFFCRLYPVAFENARILSEEIAIQGYRIPPEVSQMTAELPNMLRVLLQYTCGVLPSSSEFAEFSKALIV